MKNLNQLKDQAHQPSYIDLQMTHYEHSKDARSDAPKVRSINELCRNIIGHGNKIPPRTAEMDVHMCKLRGLCRNPVIEAAFNEVVANTLPYTETGESNPWKSATTDDFVLYFESWFTYLPQPKGGLGFILPFTWLYNDNKSGYFFLNELMTRSKGAAIYTKEIFEWTKQFILIRGKWMDTKNSAPDELISAWLEDPNTKIDHFIVPEGGFQSYNAFFTRELDQSKNPRPISSPEDRSIVVASADTIINVILSDLLLNTDINVKGRQMSMKKLLGYSNLASIFVGGTAVSCVLMPNVYHHYHSPVDGKIIESMEIPGIYNGITDGEHWFNDKGNLGQGDTDFSIFEDFHRAYYVIDTGVYGHVAIVPVGLNTISRIVPSIQADGTYYVAPGGTPVAVKKGTRLGKFAYGGSLNILLFEKGVFPGVSLLQGNRLGQMMPKQ